MLIYRVKLCSRQRHCLSNSSVGVVIVIEVLSSSVCEESWISIFNLQQPYSQCGHVNRSNQKALTDVLIKPPWHLSKWVINEQLWNQQSTVASRKKNILEPKRISSPSPFLMMIDFQSITHTIQLDKELLTKKQSPSLVIVTMNLRLPVLIVWWGNPTNYSEYEKAMQQWLGNNSFSSPKNKYMRTPVLMPCWISRDDGNDDTILPMTEINSRQDVRCHQDLSSPFSFTCSLWISIDDANKQANDDNAREQSSKRIPSHRFSFLTVVDSRWSTSLIHQPLSSIIR
jgi:hypothetical protein